MVRALGAFAVAASLLAGGCVDPGPGPASASSPQSANGGPSATLFWEAPTSNTNGSALTDLAGYRIYYGSNPQELVQTVQIDSTGNQTYVIEGLEPGTWYFAIMAIARSGAESTLSNIVVKTIS